MFLRTEGLIESYESRESAPSLKTLTSRYSAGQAKAATGAREPTSSCSRHHLAHQIIFGGPGNRARAHRRGHRTLRAPGTRW